MATRPTASLGRSAAGRLQTMIHRRRGLRLMAAAGAAVAVFAALSADRSDPQSLPPTDPPSESGRADRLAPTARGVPVPVHGRAFQVGELVDVHEISTGAAVARNALVVEADDEDAVVAVPAEQVHAMVDALTTGGVILVLVPHPPEHP